MRNSLRRQLDDLRALLPSLLMIAGAMPAMIWPALFTIGKAASLKVPLGPALTFWTLPLVCIAVLLLGISCRSLGFAGLFLLLTYSMWVGAFGGLLLFKGVSDSPVLASIAALAAVGFFGIAWAMLAARSPTRRCS
jgi:hypothetical protein